MGLFLTNFPQITGLFLKDIPFQLLGHRDLHCFDKNPG